MIHLRRAIPFLSVLALAACDDTASSAAAPATAKAGVSAPTDVKSSDDAKKGAATKGPATKTDAKKGAAKKTDATKSAAHEVAAADGPAVEPDVAEPTPPAEDSGEAAPVPVALPTTLGPMWASKWDDTLAIDVTAAEPDKEFEVLDALLLDSGEGEIAALTPEQVPSRYRGLSTVALIDEKGVSTAKVEKFSVYDGGSGTHLLIVLDRVAAEGETALAMVDPPANAAATLVPLKGRPLPRLTRKRTVEAIGSVLSAGHYEPEHGFDVGKLRAKHIQAFDVRTPQGQGTLSTVDFTLVADEDYDIAVTAVVMVDPAVGVTSTVLAPSTEGARYEPRYSVDLDGDTIDEVIVDEHWFEGHFVKIVRWDVASKAFVVDTLTGDST
ncbi:MAG: hypothetical protein K0V04_17955 [Deltaproteobacteria bacterium]|nr:hypothetical protein [Deltaproteobacteria bacterium]